MINTRKFGQLVVMNCALMATGFATAQATITLSDGVAECSATLTELEIIPADDNVIATVDSLENCLGPAEPTITQFTVNGAASTTVDEGIDVNVAWDSSNTTSCTTGGTFSPWAGLGTLDSSGQQLVSTTGLSNNDFTLTLTCSSDQGSDTIDDRVITVENSDVANACDNRPPIPGTRANSIVFNKDDNAFLYESVFDNTFPGSGNSQPVRLRNGFYVAMEFTTSAALQPGAFGRVEIAPMQPLPGGTATTSAQRLWSISACPGDFRQLMLGEDPGCVQGGPNFTEQGAFRFGGSDFEVDDGVCALEPNTTYFMNMLYTNQAPPTNEQEHSALGSVCEEDFCGNNLQPAGSGFK